MATLYLNFKPSESDGNADHHEALTTGTSKATSTDASLAVGGVIEMFSDVAHLVHVGAAPDADAEQAFYLFPLIPACVAVGPGAKVSAKTLA